MLQSVFGRLSHVAAVNTPDIHTYVFYLIVLVYHQFMLLMYFLEILGDLLVTVFL